MFWGRSGGFYSQWVFLSGICKSNHDNVSENPNGFDYPTVLHFSAQIALGVKFLHSHTVIHRDLKPENILLFTTEPMTLKITDFNTVRIFGEQAEAVTTKQVGTKLYMAPEIYTGPYTFSSDYWSLGCIMFELITGKVMLRLTNNHDFPVFIQHPNEFRKWRWERCSTKPEQNNSRILTIFYLDGLLQPNPKARRCTDLTTDAQNFAAEVPSPNTIYSIGKKHKLQGNIRPLFIKQIFKSLNSSGITDQEHSMLRSANAIHFSAKSDRVNFIRVGGIYERCYPQIFRDVEDTEIPPLSINFYTIGKRADRRTFPYARPVCVCEFAHCGLDA